MRTIKDILLESMRLDELNKVSRNSRNAKRQYASKEEILNCKSGSTIYGEITMEGKHWKVNFTKLDKYTWTHTDTPDKGFAIERPISNSSNELDSIIKTLEFYTDCGVDFEYNLL